MPVAKYIATFVILYYLKIFIYMRKMDVAFLMILMVSLFGGCSSDDTNEKQNNLCIVGTWMTDNEVETHTIIFKSDNTGEWFLTYEGEIETIHSFTYVFDGKNTLIMTEDGKTETAIISLTDKKLKVGDFVYYKQE